MESAPSRLKSKIEELISRYEALKAENAELKEAADRYEKKIETKNNRIEELEKQLSKLQLKEAFLGVSVDTAKARKKVASLIEEIDSCIGMLSD